MIKSTLKTFIVGLVIFLTILMVSCGAFLYYLLLTPRGSSFMAKKILSAMSVREEISWYKTEGNFIGGTAFEDLELNDLDWFVKPNQLKAQSLFVDINGPSLGKIVIKIDNARLFLPNADPIVFNGKLDKGILDINIYALSFDSAQLEEITNKKILKGIQAALTDIDLYIDGNINQPHLKGTLNIARIAQDGFALTEAPCQLDLTWQDLSEEAKINGHVIVREGLIHGPQTALVKLQQSKISFHGDPAKPGFDIKGTSAVEKIKMNIALKGTFEEPDLRIKSEPARPEGELLVMLATNRAWKGADETFQSGRVSADLAKDLIDYFLLAGSGSKIAQQYGISEFSLKFNEQSKGVSVTKEISKQLQASYGIEQTQNQAQAPATKQKVGGEIKVTDNLSLSAQKELTGQTQTESTETTTPKEKADDRLLIKYKKTF